MKLAIILAFAIGFCGVSFGANQAINLLKVEPQKKTSIEAKKLFSDERGTSFVIWVKDAVRPHIHEKHSESIYVLSGRGKMKIGKKEFIINKGDFFVVSPGEIHSVKTISKSPLKVLSLQAPEFFGKDRIWIEK